MHFYNQSELFQVLLSAASGERPGFAPDANLLQQYKDSRLKKAIQSLKTKNLFLYTEGTRQSTDLNAVTTIYTQPAGVRLMLIGYAENFRYGAVNVSSLAALWPQEHRVRIVGKNGRAIVEDFVPSQAGVSGEPRYTSTILTVPEIIQADEQIAVDLGYDTAAAAAATSLPAQAFIFFCLKVKDKLTQEDKDAVADIQRAIASRDFQRGLYLNCVSPGQSSVLFSSAIAGGTASCDTRPVNSPTLITGIGTTLSASKLKITDTADGYSFSLDKFMQSSALNMPDYQLPSSPVDFNLPLFTEYYQLPMPHLLRRGAQLHVDIVNGDTVGTDSGLDPIVDLQSGQYIVFQAMDV